MLPLTGSGGDIIGKLSDTSERACRLAKEAKVPVHMMLTRQDEFLATGNRSGTRQKIKAGCKKDGTLWAVKS